MTSFARLTTTVLAAPVLIMTSLDINSTTICIFLHDVFYSFRRIHYFVYNFPASIATDLPASKAASPTSFAADDASALAPWLVNVLTITFTIESSIWRHSLLSWPCPALRTNVRTDTLPHLIYKDLTSRPHFHCTWTFQLCSPGGASVTPI